MHLRGHGKALVFGHLEDSVPSEGASQSCGEFANLPGQCVDDGRRVLAWYFYQDGETRVPFHQGCDMTVAGAAEQVAFPVTRDGAIFLFCGPFADGADRMDIQEKSSVSEFGCPY